MPIQVLVGMPSHGTMPTKAAMSIAGLMKQTTVMTGFLVVEGSVLPQNREILVEWAVKERFTHLFFLDSDILCDGDVINRLLAHNLLIVGAPYMKRAEPSYPVVMEKRENGEIGSIGKFGKMPDVLFSAYAQGLGCCLIDLDVFKKIERPYFAFVYSPGGVLIHGEDIHFFEQATKAGIQNFVDPTIKVRHIGEKIYA